MEIYITVTRRGILLNYSRCVALVTLDHRLVLYKKQLI